jgi:hypothetical protein
MEQLKMNIFNNKEIQSEEDSEIDEEKDLLYKNRLKDLIDDVSKFNGFNGIQKTKEGLIRLQKNSRYIISLLIIETLDEVINCGRKQIREEDVDKALDKVLSKASGIDNAILMLKDDVSKLEQIKRDHSIYKVNEFINYVDKQDEVK